MCCPCFRRSKDAYLTKRLLPDYHERYNESGDNLDVLVGAISREVLADIKLQTLSDKNVFSCQKHVKISERYCHKLLDKGDYNHLISKVFSLRGKSYGASKQEVSKRIANQARKEIQEGIQNDSDLKNYYSYMLPIKAEGSFKNYQKKGLHRYVSELFPSMRKGSYDFTIKILYRA